MLRLQLFTTDHCSLCEQALDLLLSMPQLAGLGLEVIDIASDDNLLTIYGERIPVLSGSSNGVCRELDAPFNRAQVLAWLDAWKTHVAP